MPHSRDAEQGEMVWSSRDSADCSSGEQGIGLGSLLLYREPWQLVNVQISWEMDGWEEKNFKVRGQALGVLGPGGGT